MLGKSLIIFFWERISNAWKLKWPNLLCHNHESSSSVFMVVLMVCHRMRKFLFYIFTLTIICSLFLLNIVQISLVNCKEYPFSIIWQTLNKLCFRHGTKSTSLIYLITLLFWMAIVPFLVILPVHRSLAWLGTLFMCRDYGRCCHF